MSYSRQNPSPRFVQLIEQYRSMHRDGNPVKGVAAKDVFAGESLPRQASRIKALIARTGARTILDYGSGKGAQYLARQVTENGVARWNSIQEYWGASSIRCYDPGHEPISTPPQGKFDGVVCTDVLEHCPEEDLAWIVEELFAFADRFVFANVACFPALKTLPKRGKRALHDSSGGLLVRAVRGDRIAFPGDGLGSVGGCPARQCVRGGPLRQSCVAPLIEFTCRRDGRAA